MPVENADGLAAKETLTAIEKIVPPTNFENTDYEGRPGDRRYVKMVRFASINLTKAGWMVDRRDLLANVLIVTCAAFIMNQIEKHCSPGARVKRFYFRGTCGTACENKLSASA